jgi:hypothetical protein
MAMTKWEKEVLKLKKNHTWKSRPGHRIFVAGRGAVRFDFPQDWVVIPDADSIKLHDRQPPDDDCRLAVSYIHLPEIDWSGLPISELVRQVVEGDERGIIAQGEMHEVRRPDLELAWTEVTFIDPAEGREARSRICLARGSNIQPLITFDFWADDAARFAPVWDEVLRSLQLGMYIEDPTRGHTVH